MKKQVKTSNAPPPAGTYSQAVVASGQMVFVAGQTPRKTNGDRLKEASFRLQAQTAMTNLVAVAEAAGCDFARDCVKVTVYLRDLEDRVEFDNVFAQHVGKIPPARAIVQSSFTDFDLEVDAILVVS